MQTVNDYLSIGVDRSGSLPRLTVNGERMLWKSVANLPREQRKAIRLRLADMPDGKKMVAYTMAGAVLPLAE